MSENIQVLISEMYVFIRGNRNFFFLADVRFIARERPGFSLKTCECDLKFFPPKHFLEESITLINMTLTATLKWAEQGNWQYTKQLKYCFFEAVGKSCCFLTKSKKSRL